MSLVNLNGRRPARHAVGVSRTARSLHQDPRPQSSAKCAAKCRFPDRCRACLQKGAVPMDQFKSDFLRSLHERGYIHQVTDAAALDAHANSHVISAYIGFDATADSLHIGSLVQIMLLRRLQQAGHRPIVLMGGGTTKVGDPSGRDETRQLLTEEQINANITGIRATFARFLDFGTGPSGAIMANNDDWLKSLQYIDFLRDVGRHFTINRMLTMDSVKLRLEREQPLTFLEFNYMIMQGYDFVKRERLLELQT